MNRALLKKVIREKGDSQASLAYALALSTSTLNHKLNNWRNAEFTIREVLAIKSRYRLTNTQMDEIFFTSKKDGDKNAV